MWTDRYRRKLLAAEFPTAWKQMLETHVPLYARLPECDKSELRGLVNVFLAEKTFEGCGGLSITDETKLCVATQACVLLLHRKTDFFPELKSILIYPRRYYVTTARHLGSGIMLEREEAQLGQASPQGAIILAWDSVCPKSLAERDGRNLVLHEFAHFLDFEDGACNGAPLLPPGKSRRGEEFSHSWARTLDAEFQSLRAKAQSGEETFLDAYGARNPAEFFAVATEAFFEQPQELSASSPNLYNELKSFYLQDPAQWTPKLPESSRAIPLFNRAYAKHVKGDLQGALADYSEAIAIKRDYAAAHLCRGDVRERQGDLNGALADYDRGVYLSPDSTSNLLCRAALRQRLSDHPGALCDYTAAIRLDHHCSEAYYQRGRIEEDKGEFEAALEDFNMVIALNPDNPTLLSRRGRLLCNLQRFKEALPDYRRASELGEPLNYAHFRVWLIRSKLGENKSATEELCKRLRSIPEEEQNAWTCQIASFLLGDLAEDAFFEESRNRGKESQRRLAEASFYAGAKRLIRGDKQGAAQLFQKALDADTLTAPARSSAAAELKALKQIPG